MMHCTNVKKKKMLYVHCLCSVHIVHSFEALEFSHTCKRTNTSILYIYYVEESRKEKVNHCHYSSAQVWHSCGDTVIVVINL